MTQDEMILTLLRAVAEAMVCPTCRGQGIVFQYRQTMTGTMPIYPGNTCSCRQAIRAVLAADKVAL